MRAIQLLLINGLLCALFLVVSGCQLPNGIQPNSSNNSFQKPSSTTNPPPTHPASPPSAPTTPGAPVSSSPNSFSFLDVTAGNQQISLSWQTFPGATNYTLLRGTSLGNYNLPPITGLSSASYIDQGLKNGAAYFYSVQAMTSKGLVSVSSAVSAMPIAPPLLVVADTGNNRIVTVANMSGDQFNSLNQGANAKLSGPQGVFLNKDGSIYVADTNNSKIVRFQNLHGDLPTEFGAAGSGEGQFSNPVSVALDAQGKIFVSDSGNARVIQMSDFAGSNFMSLSGTNGQSFNSIASLAIGSNNTIFIADSGAGVLDIFSDIMGNGSNPTNAGGNLQSPAGTALDSQGNIYVADTGNSMIFQLDSQGNVLNQLAGSQDGDNFQNPAGVCVDGKGIIYIADTGNNRIVSVSDMTGSNFTTLDGIGTDNFSSPQSISCQFGSNSGQ